VATNFSIFKNIESHLQMFSEDDVARLLRNYRRAIEARRIAKESAYWNMLLFSSVSMDEKLR
jgi:hypothetical protein